MHQSSIELTKELAHEVFLALYKDLYNRKTHVTNKKYNLYLNYLFLPYCVYSDLSDQIFLINLI